MESQGAGKREQAAPEDDGIPYADIVGFLNEATGRRYRPGIEKTRRLIRARWNEGFREKDFRQVISRKAEDWKDSPKMQAYLRPETLFGTKFEGYLQESETEKARKEESHGGRWDAYGGSGWEL